MIVLNALQRNLILTVAVFMVVACHENESAGKTIDPATIDLTAKPGTQRWYTSDQLAEGKKIFSQYCAACHGTNAQATPDWKTPTAEGNYPPPPLNGTAHAWHHPLSVLDEVIREGGKPMGGVMPAWKEMLSTEQRISVIASFQSYWPDKTYASWLEREMDDRK